MADVIMLDDARAVLLQERQDRLEGYNAGMVRLSEEFGCRVAPVVTFTCSGGEEISLASVAKMLDLRVEVSLQIVEVSE